MAEPSGRRVQSVDKAFAVLRALQRLDGAGVTAVADELDISVGSTHAYLSTLEANEAIVKRDGEYRIGFGLLEYGGYARDRFVFYRQAREPVRDLAAETGELAAMTVQEHGDTVYLGVEKGENASNIGIRVGTRMPLHTLASGKAILAAMPAARRRDILSSADLEPATENTIVERSALESELAGVRERGVAFDDEERIQGMRAVAAPVTNQETGDLYGAIVVSGPKTRVDGDRYDSELPTLIRNTAREISINVSHSL